MKKTIIILSIFLICISVVGQSNKNIVITKVSKTVPVGKKWVIEAGNTTRVQINYSTLSSGSLCNALFLSNPRMISSINSGDIANINSYMLLFKDPEKIPYTNDYTYDISIITIVDKNFSVNDLQTKELNQIGVQRIEFNSGESVFVENCLESIELKEVNMTQEEMLAIKKKENDIINENQVKLANFNIYNVYTNYKTNDKPEIHDNKLKSIEFSCGSVLHRQQGKGYAVDDVSMWSFELNSEKCTIRNSNGIDKTYKLIKIEYDEQMRMQKFILGNSSKTITHNLFISWFNDHYMIILTAIDESEEYQFHTAQATDKQYQN